jgi:hypothetical protein
MGAESHRSSEFLVWLGALRSRQWVVVQLSVWALLSWCVSALWIAPIAHELVGPSDEAQVLTQLEERRGALVSALNTISATEGEKSDSVGQTSTVSVDRMLEIIHSNAQVAKVRVDSFANLQGVSDKSRTEQYRFKAYGGYTALLSFARRATDTTNGLIFSEVTLQNARWPEFSGVLEAVITVTVLSTF